MSKNDPKDKAVKLDKLMNMFDEQSKKNDLQARFDELCTLARKYWQQPIPEQAILDRLAELKTEIEKL